MRGITIAGVILGITAVIALVVTIMTPKMASMERLIESATSQMRFHLDALNGSARDEGAWDGMADLPSSAADRPMSLQGCAPYADQPRQLRICLEFPHIFGGRRLPADTMFALYDQLTVSMASLPASAPSAPGGSPVPDRSPTGVGALPDPAPPLEELSDSDLAKLYQNSTSGRRAEILNILRERNQRATTVSGEFFPDMEYKEEHNAFITIARSRAGDDVATLSESASEMSATTLEPDAFDPVETETTNKVGVQLTGANFKIEPPEIRWYTIPDGYEETVSWVVTPEKEGNLQLMVVLRNKLEVGDTELDLPVRRFPKTVTVSVDIWTQIGRAVSGVETAVDTAQKIGVAIAAVMGFGSVGAAWAAIGAWRRRGAAAPAGITESPATARTTNEPTGREGGTGA